MHASLTSGGTVGRARAQTQKLRGDNKLLMCFPRGVSRVRASCTVPRLQVRALVSNNEDHARVIVRHKAKEKEGALSAEGQDLVGAFRKATEEDRAE